MIHSHYAERCYRSTYGKENLSRHYTYPKRLNQETYIDEAGYPQYRRIHDHDRNVVLYNARMLLNFDAHINVELAVTVTLIMYLYEYIYKGHDYTMATISKNEIKQHLQGRYVSSLEVTWRIFSYEL